MEFDGDVAHGLVTPQLTPRGEMQEMSTPTDDGQEKAEMQEKVCSARTGMITLY
jgi:hypothetical protein